MQRTDAMRRRLNEVESECSAIKGGSFVPDAFINEEDCMESIKWGLSRQVYRDRVSAKQKQCSEIVQDAPWLPLKMRRDSKATIEKETCERNIMRGQ